MDVGDAVPGNFVDLGDEVVLLIGDLLVDDNAVPLRFCWLHLRELVRGEHIGEKVTPQICNFQVLLAE